MKDHRITRDLLLLVGIKVTFAAIRQWKPAQIEAAEEWAAAMHLRASDNIVRVPPRPKFRAPRTHPRRAPVALRCTAARLRPKIPDDALRARVFPCGARIEWRGGAMTLTQKGKAMIARRNRLRQLKQKNAAATHCPEGHRLTAKNTAIVGGGWRICIACRCAKSIAAKKRKKRHL